MSDMISSLPVCCNCEDTVRPQRHPLNQRFNVMPAGPHTSMRTQAGITQLELKSIFARVNLNCQGWRGQQRRFSIGVSAQINCLTGTGKTGTQRYPPSYVAIFRVHRHKFTPRRLNTGRPRGDSSHLLRTLSIRGKCKRRIIVLPANLSRQPPLETDCLTRDP